MAINKIVYGNETLIDLTEDTATESDVASGAMFHLANGVRTAGTAKYASAPVANGNADKSNAMLFGRVDSTSTATVFTATVDGLTELVDGTAVYLTNHVVTSASGFTINVNGLGAKKVYNNLTNATRDTTIFNVAYGMLFIYDSTLDSNNGGWWCYRGYDSNTNTIGYQLRTNSANMPAVQTGYRYRLWLTDADGQGWVPINTSTSTNATTARALNSRPIDPFGSIVYCEHNATKNAGEGLGTSHQWEQYPLTIGYSYVKTLVKDAPVYLKCTPQTDGSAVMADIVSALPTTNDGYIYIFLGTAYSTTAMELLPVHPVYWHDGTGIRLWTGSAVPTAYTSNPAMDGTASAGTGTSYARGNHVHPHDTSKQDKLVSGTNIKTINGEPILGSGDITVGGGGGSGGGGLLVTINITAAGVNVIYTADKTAQEIYDAISNGITPMIHEVDSYYPITMKRLTNGIMFKEQGYGYWLIADSMSAYPTYTASGGGGND